MEIKGTAVKSVFDYMQYNYPYKIRLWLETMPEISREIMENSILATRWYDMDNAILKPTIAASKMLDIPVNDLSWQTGVYSSKIALSGIYKVFIRIASTDFIISRAANIAETYYKNTIVKVLDRGAKTVTLEMLKFDKQYNLIMYRIGGWVQNTFETIGCKNVKVNIKNVDDEYEFKTLIIVSWD